MEIQKPHNQAVYGHFIVDNIICDNVQRGLKNARRHGLPAVVKIPKYLKYMPAYILLYEVFVLIFVFFVIAACAGGARECKA